jgi:putative Holliday junction resolvase
VVGEVRVLGLDVGDKTIGVAVSDPLGYTAQGVKVIRRAGLRKDMSEIKQLAREYGAGLIVVGLPRNMNGTIGEQGEKILVFAGELGKVTGLPVRTWDERLTTVAADKVLIRADLSRARRKKVIDKVAAMFILQNFLDANSENI